MDKERLERLERFANIHYEARVQVGKSQEFMALELGVSKKTVQNWEKGVSSPSFFQSVEWFKALGLNPTPYYLEYYFNQRNDTPTNDDVEESFNELIKILPTSVKRALLFIFFGRHGSSPMSLVQLTLAHIHTPLKSRVINATIIKHNYDMAVAQDKIICKEHILPDVELLDKSISEGKNSAIKNEYGYVNTKEES